MFLTPHKLARHKQLPALRNLSPAEREVVLLLGSDVRPEKGALLINYDEKVGPWGQWALEGREGEDRGGELRGGGLIGGVPGSRLQGLHGRFGRRPVGVVRRPFGVP
jgi:hypothetical protein